MNILYEGVRVKKKLAEKYKEVSLGDEMANPYANSA